jgi:hypothetical protein
MDGWNPPETMPVRTPVRICIVDVWTDKARVANGFLQYGHLWELEYRPTAKDHEKGILRCSQTADGEYVRLVQKWEAMLGWAPAHIPRKRPKITRIDLDVAKKCRLMPASEA